VAWALAAVVLFCADDAAMGAMSAEINPFVSTQLQVDARMARIQQEVDRLRAAGQFAAANDLSNRLAHFQRERGGIEGSLIAGPELDAVGMYTANGDTPIVQVRPSDRPVVLALGAYELVHWTVQVFPGANLQKVIVSGYDGAEMPSGVPAGVPVELSSYNTTGVGTYFYFYNKSQTSFTDAVKTMYQKTGLPPTTTQMLEHYLGQPFAVGGNTVEWAQERVLSEMQPLYKEATAYQLAQDRAAADAYRFTGLYHIYDAKGDWVSTRIAQMSAVKGINVKPRSFDYYYLGVDPRGAGTYYGYHPGHTLERFDPNTGQATALPAYSGNFGSIVGMAFDTLRNRLAISTSGADSANSFLFFNPDAGTWQRTAIGTPQGHMKSLTYSAVNDAFYAVETGANDEIALYRFDPNTLVRTEIGLSQFMSCFRDRCELAASGDRLVLIAPPTVDAYEPLSGPVQHSYLIDPVSGHVTILGAVPEPGAIGLLAFVSVALMRGGPRRKDFRRRV
jgi:hypothetical protein